MNTKANIIAILHTLWILFALISFPLLFLIDYWSKISLVFVMVTVLSWFVFRGCLLLQLENRYRVNGRDGKGLGEDSFIQFYIRKFFHIELTRTSVRIGIYLYMAVLGITSIAMIL